MHDPAAAAQRSDAADQQRRRRLIRNECVGWIAEQLPRHVNHGRELLGRRQVGTRIEHARLDGKATTGELSLDHAREGLDATTRFGVHDLDDGAACHFTRDGTGEVVVRIV
jgi:hypothetical protein